MSIQNLSAEELRQRLREQPEHLEIVDVRQPLEFAAVHIRGSKLIPLDQFESRWGEIDWTKEVVFVCPQRRPQPPHGARWPPRPAGRSGTCVSGFSSVTATARENFSEVPRGGVERYF